MKRQTRNWKKLIEEHSASGKSVTDFCAAKGIHPNSFYTKRKSFKKQALVEIPGPSTIGTLPLVLRIGRYSLSIERGFDPGSLKSVLEVIGGIE